MTWLLFVFQQTHVIAHFLIVHTHPTGPSQGTLSRYPHTPAMRCVRWLPRAPPSEVTEHFPPGWSGGWCARAELCRLRGGRQVAPVFKCISVLGLRGMLSGSEEGGRQGSRRRVRVPVCRRSLGAARCDCSGCFQGALRRGPWKPLVGPAPDGSLGGS